MTELVTAQTMLVGTLPDGVPLQAMIPLADSILAAPVLTIVVDNRTENGDTLVQTLVERGEDILEVVPLNGRELLTLYPGFADDPKTPEDAVMLLDQGTKGILLPLWLHDGQTMAETITRARAFRTAILGAVQPK